MTFLRHYIDNVLLNLSTGAISIFNSMMVICAGLTISDWLDLSQKWATFTITVVVGFLSARHYILKNRKLQREIELKDQEIYKVMEQNKTSK